MGTSSVDVLFAGFRSGAAAGAVMVVVLVRVPGGVLAGSVPLIVNVTNPPATRLTGVLSGPVPEGGHVDPSGPPVQVHLRLVSAGEPPGSLTIAPMAALEPLFRATTR
jgi:hypothetical protein